MAYRAVSGGQFNEKDTLLWCRILVALLDRGHPHITLEKLVADNADPLVVCCVASRSQVSTLCLRCIVEYHSAAVGHRHDWRSTQALVAAEMSAVNVRRCLPIAPDLVVLPRH